MPAELAHADRVRVFATRSLSGQLANFGAYFVSVQQRQLKEIACLKDEPSFARLSCHDEIGIPLPAMAAISQNATRQPRESESGKIPPHCCQKTSQVLSRSPKFNRGRPDCLPLFDAGGEPWTK